MGQRGTGQSGQEFTQCDRLGRGQPLPPPQALPRSPSSQLCLAHPPASPNLSLAPRWCVRPLSPCTFAGTVPSAPRRLSFLIHPTSASTHPRDLRAGSSPVETLAPGLTALLPQGLPWGSAVLARVSLDLEPRAGAVPAHQEPRQGVWGRHGPGSAL